VITPQPHPTPPPGATPDLGLSRSIARLTDDLVRIPGTGITLGLDAVVGLVPGIGDAVGTALSSAILFEAVRLRVPIHVLGQMAWHLIVDTGLGLVPVVGDAADVMHRANRKNVRLLQQTIAEGRCLETTPRGYLLRAGAVVAGIIALMLTVTILTIWGIVALLGTLF